LRVRHSQSGLLDQGPKTKKLLKLILIRNCHLVAGWR